MFQQLLETLQAIDLGEDPKLKHFVDRTNNHIALVKKAAAEIVNAYPEYAELLSQVEMHDASKFEEPELTPYIELTWQKKIGKGKNPNVTGDEDITNATLHHITHNRHHPGFHLEDKKRANLSSTNRDESIECVDAVNMPDIDVAEMVSDWQAMSEELGTNTSREWYDKVKDVRWRFSPEQDLLIDKLLKVFEED